MMTGFTYNGIHSSEFFCKYIPDSEAKFNDKADFEIMDEDIAWQDGGCYYGNRIQSREFKLECFFEDITAETKERMMQWQDRKTDGRLIFDERPYIYYNVRPSKKPTGKMYTTHHDGFLPDTYSGTQTITFKAYDPYGYMLYSAYDDIDIEGAQKYSGILHVSEMPTPPSTASKSFQLYNCGTETCNTVIRIAGTAPNGLVIKNKTNDQMCSILSLPAAPSYLEIDSQAGTVKTQSNTTDEGTLAFELHDEGYITQEPCGQLWDAVTVSYSSGSKTVTLMTREADPSQVGKYIRLDDKWILISSVDGNTLTLNSAPTTSGAEKTRIVTMNDILITGDGFSLTKLEIEYVPRVL